MCEEHGEKIKRTICSVTECKNIAQRGGVCHRHDATYKKIALLKVVKKVVRNGLCEEHGEKIKPKKKLCVMDCVRNMVKRKILKNQNQL